MISSLEIGVEWGRGGSAPKIGDFYNDDSLT
jgi:hypothetical protein